ncbi:hypothetical protein AAG570_010732 [Ranatra chinensis]|uniref:Uncharacterized protein n=1 Tax=Ranatra chinensis TaxID=642074 RepID=A0ABD0YNE1_9HEMI
MGGVGVATPPAAGSGPVLPSHRPPRQLTAGKDTLPLRPTAITIIPVDELHREVLPDGRAEAGFARDSVIYKFTTLNYTDLGSPFGEGASGGSNTPTPTSMSADIEHHHNMSLNHQDSGGGGGSGSITPVPPTSKSAFIELQQHSYNPVRAYHPHHFQQAPGQGNPGHHEAGFGSPRALSAYPFPPMHHNSYTGYHLGTYAPQCPSPPKDVRLLERAVDRVSFAQNCAKVMPRGGKGPPFQRVSVVSCLWSFRILSDPAQSLHSKVEDTVGIFFSVEYKVFFVSGILLKELLTHPTPSLLFSLLRSAYPAPRGLYFRGRLIVDVLKN